MTKKRSFGRYLLPLALGAALIPACAFASDGAQGRVSAAFVDIPVCEHLPYKGLSVSRFPHGIPIGVGSGLTYAGKEYDGTLLFLTISDRGPNTNTPPYVDEQGKKHPTKVFLIPENSAHLGFIAVKDGKAELRHGTVTLKNAQGKPITGRPRFPGMVGYTGEVCLSETLQKIEYDAEGVDPEGIDIGPDGNYWICDESGPFIMKIEAATGKVLRTYAPGTELPEILMKRSPNRGLEGIAVLPSGKVVAAVQSILNVDGNIKKSAAQFIRMIVLDPATGAVKTVAYPHDISAYKRSRDAKIGDLATIDENRLLLVEQGTGKDKKLRNLVYAVDLSEATDITNMTAPDGKPLETVKDPRVLEELGVKMAKKKLVADLRALGWQAEKAEGLAIVDDNTIALCADNDFGILESISEDVLDKGILNHKGQILIDGTVQDLSYTIVPTGEKSLFWVLTLPESLR